MYIVTNGRHYNDRCCFDYGNAEVDNNDDGPGTMEAVYFGNAKGNSLSLSLSPPLSLSMFALRLTLRPATPKAA